MINEANTLDLDGLDDVQDPIEDSVEITEDPVDDNSAEPTEPEDDFDLAKELLTL